LSAPFFMRGSFVLITAAVSVMPSSTTDRHNQSCRSGTILDVIDARLGHVILRNPSRDSKICCPCSLNSRWRKQSLEPTLNRRRTVQKATYTITSKRSKSQKVSGLVPNLLADRDEATGNLRHNRDRRIYSPLRQ
jgi:hypothetical protein